MGLGSTLLTGLIPVCVSAVALHAQEPLRSRAGVLPTGPGRISGRVITAENNQPLATAVITARSATDSTFVKAGTAAPDGRFQVEELPLGDYRVRIQHVGYRAVSLATLTLRADTPTVDAGTVRLEVAPVELPAVQARASSAPVVLEADRTIHRTKDLPAAAGNAIDLMRAVPELEVDVSGAITMRGNQRVAIHVNGRPAPLRGDQLTNYLRQLPGSRIVQIEVLSNPSAKFDPEGLGGIVNLVLREPGEGFSGNISANASTLNNRGLSGSLNLQNRPLTVFASGAVGYTDSDGVYDDLRKNLITQPITFIEQHSRRSYNNLFHTVELTAELLFGRTTLWGSAWLYGNDDRQDIATSYDISAETSGVFERYDRQLDGSSDNNSHDLTIGLKHVFERNRHELTVDLRRTGGRNDHQSDWTREYQLSAGQSVDWPTELSHYDIDGDNNNLTVKADYFRPLGRSGRFEIGYQAWTRGEGNDNQTRTSAAALRGEPSITHTGYDHDETFHSLYTTVSQTRGRATVQLGVRAEQAITTFALPSPDEAFDNNYESLFPSGSIAYDLGQGRRARLSYSKRIGRPTPYLLNPAIPNNDPLNLYFGNPRLRPTYTHQLNLDLSWVGKRGTLRLTPNYRRTIDNWDQIRLVDENGGSLVTWTNAAALDVLGAALTVSLLPAARISGSATASVYRETRDASNISAAYSHSYWRGSGNLNLGYRIANTLAASTSWRYTPPYTLMQGRASGVLYSSIGLRQQLWRGRGALNVQANDPFDLFRFTFETVDSTHSQQSRTTVRQRMLALSITYSFGTKPEQTSRRETEEAPQATIIR